MKEVVFYRREDGSSPVEEFMDSLNSKQAQKVIWVLKLFEDLEIVPSQYWKKLVNTDDIWEVRVSHAGNIFRILGFEERGNFVVLTHGFTKKTQKTPKKEIKLAEERKRIYQRERKQR